MRGKLPLGDALRRVIQEETDRNSFGADKATYVSVTEAVPVWADGKGVRVREVTCPILDVVNRQGAPVALMYQDGVTSFPMQIGTIRDESFSPTVRIKADLQNEPTLLRMGTGQIETGLATQHTVATGTAASFALLVANLDSITSAPNPTAALPLLQAMAPLLKQFVTDLRSDGAFSTTLKGSP